MTNLKTGQRKLSIVICTYNRPESLELSIKSLLPYTEWLSRHCELIIVDNNSDAATKRLIDLYLTQLPIRYFFESKQGLAAARNRALKEFSSSMLVFFDDDITITLDCLKTYYAAMLNNSEADFFGGKITVDWQNNKPAWLKSDDLVLLNGLFGHYDLGDQIISYTNGVMTPFGANFAIRRSLIEKVGVFDESLGVSGSEIGRGEETDYFKRALALGCHGKYLPDAEIFHRFQVDRLSSRYLFKYGVAKGNTLITDAERSDEIDTNSIRHSPLIKIAEQTVKGLFQLLKGRRDRYYQCVINVGIAYALQLNSRKNGSPTR